MRTDKPTLRVTKDYALFKSHELNRPLSDKPILLASMKKHGFMPSSPIQAQRNGDGRLKVVRGHHRLNYAKQLGIPVWYVIDDSNTDIFDLEASPSTWSLNDFVVARAHSGDKHCLQLIAFKEQHGLPLGVAASLLGGQTATSGNKQADVKAGKFEVCGDLSHATAVVAITDRCRELGIKFATKAAFVMAVSQCLRVPEFEIGVFLRRLELHHGTMAPRSSADGCLDEIEAIYNFGSKAKRFPLAFRAREVGKERKFGGQ